MTLSGLTDEIFSGPDKPLLLTKRRQERVVECCVLEWTESPMTSTAPKAWRQFIAESFEAGAMRRYKAMAGWEVILWAVLASVISWAVQRFLEWWFERPRERSSMIEEMRLRLSGI